VRKILIIYNGYLNRGGGVVTHLNNLKNELEKRNIEVNVWSRDKLNKLNYVSMALLQRLGDIIKPGWGYLLFVNRTRRLIKKFIKENKPEIVIFEDIFLPDKTFNCKWIAFLHAIYGDPVQSLGNRKFINLKQINIEKYAKNIRICEEKEIINKKEKIYTVSNEFSKKIEEFYKLDFKIGVIENFLSSDTIATFRKASNLNKGNRTIDFIYTGVFNKRKNLQFIIEVFKLLKEKYRFEPSLYLIGDGLEKDTLEKEIRESNLANIILHPFIQDKYELAQILLRSKAFLLASLDESFSYSLAEAKLCGLYTFVNKDLTIPEYLIDYRLPLNKEIWCEKIVEFIRNYSGPSESEKYYEILDGTKKIDELLSKIMY